MEVDSGQNQGQVCGFPFSIDGHEFYDCTYYNNADICKCFINFEKLFVIRNQHFKVYNISATGNETWCATVTKPESLEVDGDNWGLCMDEKSLAYDGGTAGEPCSFPFLINEK